MTASRQRLTLLALTGLLGLAGLLGLIALVDRLNDVKVMEVRATVDDRQLEAVLDTCNADLSVDVEEYDDRVVLHAKHHDWYRYLFGSDDCLDMVQVALDGAVGEPPDDEPFG